MFTDPEAVDGVDAVVITHEHPDHYLPDHLARTDAPIFTITAVADRIGEDAPALSERVTVVSPGQSFDAGIAAVSVGELHAVIHPDLPRFYNSGYVFDLGGTTVYTRATHSRSRSSAWTCSAFPSPRPGCARRRASTSRARSARLATSRSTTACTPRPASRSWMDTSACCSRRPRRTAGWPMAPTWTDGSGDEQAERVAGRVCRHVERLLVVVGAVQQDLRAQPEGPAAVPRQLLDA